MCSAEDYRAKAAEYERLTLVTKSLRESRQYRKQAERYRALALGEEPEISTPTKAGANRCPKCDTPITAPFESKYLTDHKFKIGDSVLYTSGFYGRRGKWRLQGHAAASARKR